MKKKKKKTKIVVVYTTECVSNGIGQHNYKNISIKLHFDIIIIY